MTPRPAKLRAALGAAAVLFAALTLAAPAHAQPTPAEIPALVETIVARSIAEPRAAGLSFAVLRDGEVLVEAGAGKADLESGAGADGATMFRIGSITKQFTAALVMRQVERGALSLDDPLTKFFPEWPSPGEKVTIHHLLNHTSGIRSYTEIDAFMEGSHHDRTADEMLALFQDEPWDFQPGERWRYNNSGYYLLGVILERVGAAPWGEQVNALAAELGLARTRVDDNRAILANRAQGYAWSGEGLVNDRFISPTIPYAAGAMLSTAGDLVRWAEMLATGGVVGAESYALMTAPAALAGGETFPYGCGLMIEPFDERPSVAHGGGIFGFNSYLVRLPEEGGLTVAVISNSETLQSDVIASKIARAALGSETPAPLPVSAELAASVQGTYRIEAAELEVKVFERDGALFTQAADQPAFPMVHEGEGVFRLDMRQRIELAFDLSAAPSPGFMLRQGGAELPAKRVAGE